jgi:hypothetical protein
MASSSASGSVGDTPLAESQAAARDILMFTDHTQQETQIKFRNVSYKYDIMDIKHADFVGMFWTFNNGETWLTLKEKRLFVVATEEGENEVGPESEEDWPIMEPDELKEVLSGGEFPSYEEVSAKWKKVEQRLIANSALMSGHNRRDKRGCMKGQCNRDSHHEIKGEDEKNTAD